MTSRLLLFVSTRSHFQPAFFSSSSSSSLSFSSLSSLAFSSSLWYSLSPFLSSAFSSLRKQPQLLSLFLHLSSSLSSSLVLSSSPSRLFLVSSFVFSRMALPTSSSPFSPSPSGDEASAASQEKEKQAVVNAEKKETLSPSKGNVREKEEHSTVKEGSHQQKKAKKMIESDEEKKHYSSQNHPDHDHDLNNPSTKSETDMQRQEVVAGGDEEEEKTSSSSILSSSGLEKEEEEEEASVLSSSTPPLEEEEEDHPSHFPSCSSSSTSKKGAEVESKVPFHHRHLEVLNEKKNDRVASALVIAGPSGVGKGTLVKKLFHQWPRAFGFSVSHTSRAPRPGEVNGREYFFCSRRDFLSLQAQHYFLETAEFSGNLYGTSFSAVNEVMKTGRICVLEIDMTGVIQVQNSSLGSLTKFVFLQPPSLQELEQRLRGRDTEKEFHIKTRLETAEKELALAKKVRFDFYLVNDNIDDAWSKLKTQIEAWYGTFLN